MELEPLPVSIENAVSRAFRLLEAKAMPRDHPYRLILLQRPPRFSLTIVETGPVLINLLDNG